MQRVSLLFMRRKTVRSEPARERTVAFASVIMALSLFGFLWPFHDSTQDHHSATGFKDQGLPRISLPRSADPGWGPLRF